MILASTLAPLGLLSGPGQVSAADPATYATTSTYELLPESGLVRVTVTLTVQNNHGSTEQSYSCTDYYFDPSVGYVPYTTTCTTTTSYYIDNAVVVVDPDGTNFSATTPGGTAGVTVASGGEGFLSIATVTFPAVQYGQTRTMTVTYDLRGGAPRSDSYVRAGRAYARFCGFPAGAYVGSQDSVRIVVPAAYKVTQYFGTVVAQARDATSVVLDVPQSIRSDNPDIASTCIESVNRDSYVGTDFTSGSGVQLRINAWPDDAEWLATVSGAAEGALDDLEAAIGLPPVARNVSVEEVVTEAINGYAGQLDVNTHVVRLSETAIDPVVAVHEIAHLWFDDHFSVENWLTEGYSEYFARLVVPDAPDCEKPAATALDGINLSDWIFLPRLATDDDVAAVDNQYATACWLVTEVTSKMPPDAIKEIYAAAVNSEIAYVGDGAAEKLTPGGPLLWRRWLDIVDERVLAYDAADPDWLQGLLASVGITDSEDELTARSDARAAYHQLLADAEPWAAPYAVRLLMSNWAFGDAEGAITTASKTSALHRAAVDKVAQLSESTTVEEAYEGAEDQAALDEARDLAEAELKAAGVVAKAVAAAKADRGPLEVVGLLGGDLPKDATAAVSALVVGQLKDATKQGAQVVTTHDGAVTAGGLRLGGAAVVLVGGSGTVILFRRRQARRTAMTAAPDASTDDSVAPEPAAAEAEAEDRSAEA